MTAARTLIELIRRRDVSRLLGLQLLDGALTRELVALSEFRLHLEALGSRCGIRLARELVALSRAGVGSPGETALRLGLVDAGIPDEWIEIDLQIREEDGLVLARGDLGSARSLLWVEYDGFEVHTQRNVFASDRGGDRWLTERGWLVMRFSGADLRYPERNARQWRQAVADAPARIAALPWGRSPEADAAKSALTRPRDLRLQPPIRS